MDEWIAGSRMKTMSKSLRSWRVVCVVDDDLLTLCAAILSWWRGVGGSCGMSVRFLVAEGGEILLGSWVMGVFVFEMGVGDFRCAVAPPLGLRPLL